MPRSLQTLLTVINGTRDAMRPSIQSFPPLNVEQVAAELSIDARARAQGAEGKPKEDAEAPDSDELVIGEEIERRARQAFEEYRAALELYDSRIRDAIIEMERAVERVERAARELEAAGNGGEIAEQLESLSYRVENQDGLLTRYENQLARLGQGIGGRPCWVQPNGDIDFLYDVVLRSDGISMREREYPHRAAERARLPMPHVDAAETLTAAEFRQRTAPLYEVARKEGCVFFVVVYDATAPHEKGVFVDLLRTIEGHFYKSFPPNAAAPF